MNPSPVISSSSLTFHQYHYCDFPLLFRNTSILIIYMLCFPHNKSVIRLGASLTTDWTPVDYHNAFSNFACPQWRSEPVLDAMKFARGFRESLASQDFPPHWVDQAIPYGQLKKCLKKVSHELQSLGLDPETLRSLTDPNTTSPVALKYQLNPSQDSHVRPRLTVLVQIKDGVVVDASLTPKSRRFLETIADEIDANRRRNSSEEESIGSPVSETSPSGTPISETANHEEGYETIELPLVFDAQFFEMLQSDVDGIDALQDEEQKVMSTEVVELSKEVSKLSKPSRFSKSDLARWRQIFELYLDAEVFFATREQTHGSRSSESALKQLQWFQGEVQKRELASKFKFKESHDAFTRFIKLNMSLLKNLQFQELNQTAIFKILKKFDKRTALGISSTFRKSLHSQNLMAGKMSKDVCAQLSDDLMSVVPNINDYLCPVCFTIAYRAVRLECQHVFCIRCIIKIQRKGDKHCPLCRADVIMKASADNLDRDLEKYMKKYFSKETHEKVRQNELERGIEDYGPNYDPRQDKCVVM